MSVDIGRPEKPKKTNCWLVMASYSLLGTGLSGFIP